MGHQQTYELGEGVAQHDVDAFGLSLAARLTRLYLPARGPARSFLVIFRSTSAILGITNPNSRSIREHALNFAYMMR